MCYWMTETNEMRVLPYQNFHGGILLPVIIKLKMVLFEGSLDPALGNFESKGTIPHIFEIGNTK